VDRPKVRVLLATSSPIIQTFFATLAGGEVDSFVVDTIPLAVSALHEQHNLLTEAGVAVVEMAPAAELSGAIRFCEALHAQRRDLPVVALVHGHATSRSGTSDTYSPQS